jgi:ribonuclease P protein component
MPEQYRPWQRVRSKHDHQKVLQRGKRQYIGPLVVRSCANCQGAARLGTAISKRSLRRAVDRNRVKRVIRDSFRRQAAQLPAMDVVISLSQRVRLDNEQQLRTALDKTWQRLSELP